MLLAGELSAEQALEVESHLDGCSGCRLEVSALRSLTTDEGALTELERTRLRRAVKASLPEPAGSAEERGLWRRAAPFLSAAAALLILGFGIASLDLGGDDSGDAASVTGEELKGGADAGGGGAEAGRAEDGNSTSASGGDRDDAGEESAAGTAGDSLSSEPAAPFETNAAEAPTYKSGGSFSLDALERQARRRDPYRTAALNYAPATADRDRPEFLKGLVRSAEKSGRSGETLRDCAEAIVTNSTSELLPVFGAFGRLDARSALVLGFIAATGDAYDRYLVAISSPPEDCSDPRLLRGELR